MESSHTPRLTAAATPGRYLRNAWYVAGWASDLGNDPWSRIFLEEPVALFRDAEGVAHAVEGRCPHRFAALGRGRVVDGALECPYHGLRFDGRGACVHNPQGEGRLPHTGLRSYPLVEAHALLWIWMGAADRADPALIPDFSWLNDPRWAVVRGATLAEGHYELYTDNILDLSHANFVHPALVADAFTTGQRRFWQEDGQVHSEYVQHNAPLSVGLAPLFDAAGHDMDFYGHVEWQAPAVLFFDYRAGRPGTPREDCRSLPSLHAFTPATGDETHYIWATARDFAVDNAEVSAGMLGALKYAFEEEDLPMIRECHRLMKGQDFWALRPLVLEGDGGGVRARRALQRLIEAENNDNTAGADLALAGQQEG
ncbi:Rieske 2Fe-2S domain-containing protein [Novosphingobium sp. FSY-8]|uniref:Rieske 2Fe-2S domain-containing protein n=1 Tax=Novosphingobium ovatum TaxID=1908523 RepID=A0ABW9XDV0_9SPHN|nr:aromatic ring-hydroxylating dioxygenase subunit alpha [Novosphingobium ovatum]NBC36709.1 Rieske 2Fe-2S domain-containing protein [Novosphingobium ovatum]